LSKLNIVHVGSFGTAIGLKGEIKINLLTSSIDVFKSLDLYFNLSRSIEWKFDSIVMRQNKCIAHPSHCKTRNDAEKLTNQKIFSLKENFASSKKDNEYYVSDLVSCEIKHADGNVLGEVINVANFGAGDLLETMYKGKKIYIPLNDDNTVSVDIEEKIIIVKPIKGIIDNV